MKNNYYTWSLEDVKAGRVVTKAEALSMRCDGWVVTWTSKIGYINDCLGGPDNQNYVLINLSDGRVSDGMSKDELLTHLNRANMAPMPNEKVLELMEYLKPENENGRADLETNNQK